MAPLWRQKFKDECKEVENRARSRRERKRSAELALGLSDKYNFDAWIPPWVKKVKDLEGDEAKTEENAENGEAGPGVLRSTRLIVAELQRIRVPATSDAADKIVYFHEAMVKLSACPPSIPPP